MLEVSKSERARGVLGAGAGSVCVATQDFLLHDKEATGEILNDLTRRRQKYNYNDAKSRELRLDSIEVNGTIKKVVVSERRKKRWVPLLCDGRWTPYGGGGASRP